MEQVAPDPEGLCVIAGVCAAKHHRGARALPDTKGTAAMVNRRTVLVGGGALLVGAGAGAWATSRQMGSMAEYSKAMAMLRAPLPASPQARDLIRYATLAPNGHNTQPWKFRERDGRIDISPDLARRTPVVDPDDHHLFISLGCAAESLALAAAAGGARRRNCL